MAEGVFSISADIVPVLDERQLQSQAQALVKQFNNLLAKEVKPIQLAANTKGLEQAQTFTSRIISQLTVMDKDASTFNRTLSTTANVFDLATKNAVGLVQRGIRPILDGLQQIAPIATRAFGTIASIGGAAFNVARAGALQFTNAINLTSTNILGYAGNIRKAIQENTRFKDGLDFIKRSGDSLRTLPQTFANVQAQVIAGVSPLQRAAQAGSGMARSLTPFLVVGVAVAREVSALSANFRTLIHDVNDLVASFVPLGTRVKSALDAFDNPKAQTAVENLRKAVPGLADDVNKVILSTRGSGLDPFVGKLRDMRDAFIETELRGTGVSGMLKRLFAGQFSAQTDKAKADLREINKTLIDVGAAKDVPFFKRFSIQAEEAFGKLKDLAAKGVAAIEPSARNIVFTAAIEISKASQQVKESAKKLGDDFRKGFEDASSKAGGSGFKAKFAGFFGGLGKAFDSEAGNIGTGFISKIFKSSESAGGKGGIISKLLGGAGGGGGGAAEGALGSLKNAFSGLIGSAGGLGEALGPLAGAAGIGGIAIAALNAAAQMETLKTALGGIFGSQAKEGFKQIQAFAAVTPFTTETATNAVIKLGSAFKGLTIPGGLAITKQIAGAAAAIGASDDAINRVTLAFTQIQASGKLTADNVRQVTEALPNVSQVGIIDALAKGMGVTTQQAKNLYSQGLIPADKGLQAIIQAFHDVPGAANALEKQSQTFTGLVSTAKDTVTQFLGAIGGPLLAAAKPVLKVIIGYFQLLTEGAKAVGFIITNVIPRGFGLLINAITPVRDAIKSIGDFIGAVGDKVSELVAKIETVPFLKSAIDAVSGAFGGMGSSAAAAGTAVDDGLKLALSSLDPVKRGIAAVIAASNPKEILKAFGDLTDAQDAAHNALVTSDIDILKKTLAVKSAFDARTAASKAVTTAELALTDAVAKHDKELKDNGIKLEKDLADARINTSDANEKLTESQAKLDKLLLGASAEDLEKGDIALAQAKLRLRQIMEDEKKAQDALNASQSTAIDLTGLSVEDVKSRLRVAGAALAAQKALAAGPAGGTTEQKAINKDTAAITKRQAELDIADAIATQNTLKAKGSALDPDIIAARKEVATAQRAVTDDIAKEKDIQTQLNVLHGPDLAFEKEKKGLQEAITTAQIAQKDAAQAAQLAVLEAKGDQEGILKLLGQQINAQPELKKLLEQSNIPIANAKSLAELLGGEFVANKTKVEAVKSEADLLNEALQKSIDLAKQFGLDSRALEFQREILRVGADTKNAGTPKEVGALIDARFKPLINEFLAQKGASQGVNTFISNLIDKNFKGDPNDPKFKEFQQRITDVAVLAATRALTQGVKGQDEINDAIKQALSTIPGIGPLKFADGGVVDKATPGIFGEAGREAILPLTRPMRMADILSHPHVLPPVLAALDKISLPRANSEPMTDLSGIRMVRSAPQVPDHHVQAKRDEALAKAIVSEMKDAGMSMGQTIVNNEFVAPDGNDPLAKIHAAQIAREVKRQIEKLL